MSSDTLLNLTKQGFHKNPVFYDFEGPKCVQSVSNFDQLFHYAMEELRENCG